MSILMTSLVLVVIFAIWIGNRYHQNITELEKENQNIMKRVVHARHLLDNRHHNSNLEFVFREAEKCLDDIIRCPSGVKENDQSK